MTRNKKHQILNKPDDIVNEKKLDINKNQKIKNQKIFLLACVWNMFHSRQIKLTVTKYGFHHVFKLIQVLFY